MRRLALFIAAIAAVVVVACSNGDNGASPSPTAPSPTGGGGGSAPPPQSSCIPAAPTNLVVTSVVGTTVTLTWSSVSGATQYIVLVGSSPSSSNILSTNTTNTSYSWGGVPEGRHYARIQATNSCGTSGSSNEVNFTV